MFMNQPKYQGTLEALQMCIEDVHNNVYQFADRVPDSEIKAFREMVVTFHDFLITFDLLKDEIGLNVNSLDTICREMAEEPIF